MPIRTFDVSVGLSHAPVRDHAPDPDFLGCIHHKNQVEPRPLPGFHQQRDVLNDDSFRLGICNQLRRTCTDQRVDDGVELFAFRMITENRSAERRTVQSAVVGQNLFPERRHHGLQSGSPRFDDFASEHVGIDEQRATFTQPPRHQRFTRGNAACQTDLKHSISLARRQPRPGLCL